MIDYNDWQLSRTIFLQLNKTYGPFDLDGACDDQGENAHVWDFCSPSRSFLTEDFAGKNVYLNAPFDQLQDFLAHYLRTKMRAPSTRGVFIVPKWRRQPWYRLLKNFTKIREIPAGSQVFTHPVRNPAASPGRQAEGPTRWPVEVYIDNSDRVRFLPHELQVPKAPQWGSTRLIVTSRNRVALVRGDDGAYGLPQLQISSEDQVPTDTALRTVSTLIGARPTINQIEMIGKEYPEQHADSVANSLPVFMFSADLGAVHPVRDGLVWASWDDIIQARSTGHLQDGQLFRADTFGRTGAQFINLRTGPRRTANLTAAVTGDHRLLTVRGSLGNTAVRVLIDSGATLNFVSRSHLRQHNGQLQHRLSTGPKTRVRQADGTRTTSSTYLRTELKIEDYSTKISALSTDLGSWDLILGRQWLDEVNPDIDWTTNTVRDRNTGNILFQGEDYVPPAEVNLVSAQDFARQLRKTGTSDVFLATLKAAPGDLPVDDDADVYSPDLKRRIKAVFDRYDDITKEPSGLPPARAWDFGIELEDDATIPQQRTYRMSPAELEEVKRQLQDLLERGWIQPSSSPYGAPILFARKKGGALRMCVDYRQLNAVTKKNRTPLPRIDELLDSLHGATVFSSLDLFKGYHQLRVKEEDVHKTAFRTHYGLFEFKVMCFGLTNAPAQFQTMMNKILSPYLGRFCVVYLDDILIYSRTPEEHEQHVDKVLQLLRQHKLHVQVSKCFLARKRVEFLGHIVEGGQIRMDPRKVKAVQDWPTPSSPRDVRGFLGLAGYYRKFIHRFAGRAAPLFDLTKHDVDFKWTTGHQAAFDDIKAAMAEEPVLIIPDTSPKSKYTLYTDASGFALGAVLLQDQGNGLQPVAYHARKMNKHECNYPVHEQELLGVVDALRTFRCYLDGCAEFTVITDHHSLKYFFSQRELSRRQVRWLQIIAPFQRAMNIVYKKGAMNHADALSRRPDLKDALQRLKLLDDYEMNEEELEDEAFNFNLQASLIDNTALLSDIKKCYRRDKMYSKGSLPTWITKQPDGLFMAYGTRICIPDVKELKKTIMSEFHDAPTCGHSGVNKMQRRMSLHFWWPRMSREIRSYVNACPTCQLNKPVNHKPYGPLQPHDAPTRPWQVVSLDLITDLPSCEGMDAVVVFCDLLTKMSIFEPTTKTVTAEELAKLFQRQVFRRHGIPEKLVSDRDPRFMSEFWQQLFRRLGTKLNISTAYHPQTDGQTERTNRTLEQIIRCYVNPLHNDWLEYLYLAEFAFNSQVSASTSMTPFMANYGFNPAAPADLGLPTARTAASNLEEHITRLQELHKFATTTVTEAHARQAAYANRSRLPVPFRVGDHVKIQAHPFTFGQQPCPKFRNRFVGPVKILQQVSPVAFKVQLPPGARCHDVFHVSRLEKWTTDAAFNRKSPQPAPLIADPAAEFVVDKLVDVDFNSNSTGLLFKVKWASPFDGDDYDSWEPLRGLNKLSALDDFLKTPTWTSFKSTPDFSKFQRRFPKRIPAEDS